MKKIFTFALALMASMSLMAETESNPTSGTKDTDLAGTSYTLAGDFIAGSGSAKAGAMPNKGIKVRLNKPAGELSNALEFTVNEGYAITDMAIIGITNSDNKAATVGSIYVDGTAWNGTFDGALPAKNASAASNIAVSGVNATQSIVFVFSDLGGASQANICWDITYEEAAPSTDPELAFNKTSFDLAVTASIPNPSATVTLKGKNLTPGQYTFGGGSVMGLEITPSTITVGEDGKVNQDITISYANTEDADPFQVIKSITIDHAEGAISAQLSINLSATHVKNYLTQSINIEQTVLDNGTKYNIKAAFDAMNIEYHNIDALDSLNDDYSKTNRNYPFLGLKMKKTDAYLACWLQAGSTIRVRFGNVGADFLVQATGLQDMTLTADLMANATPESDKVLQFTAQEDTYVKILCNSTSTLVVKQIMLNENIASVTLPAPSVYTVSCAEAEHGAVKLANGKTKGSFAPGETVELVLAPEAGYLTTSLTYNGTALHDEVEGQPITFTMPAEPVNVVAVFDTSFPTAIDQTEAAVKAVKVLRNGQLFIEKNGVLYDAQGTIVK